ncbi:hypothetical protein SAMN05421788_104430 [Filimonas lacunae]|uniref:Glycosyl transferases group 1 n=1 Tax=Filimonas lacunae TaxID=477680 RepID=A0A173MRX8_9BACT|nr:hypothetical protein [Filimonas lacunae]BAV10200.1 hypothetical protein FLA_6260 [Filimonas lacunae]SIT18335.1 hypothetical protein SAMN05421788_104430 [Filimonas lacunae]
MQRINIIKSDATESYYDCFDEFEKTIVADQRFHVNFRTTKATGIKLYLLKIAVKLGVSFRWRSGGKRIRFAMLMGASFDKLFPAYWWKGDNYVYMYDAWPRFLPYIIKSCKALNIKTIFFSSHKSAEYFNKQASGINAYWIPEGIHVQEYKWRNYNDKNIDVLEFGRKYDMYHNAIAPALELESRVHLYEKVKGQVVFQTRADFIDALSRAKISVCVPSNITNPERAEDISSMTLRYLQSMVSKCLIVGVLPEEMKELFNYCPIIEIEEGRYAEQIVEVLNNYDQYIPLIEKNYQAVTESHTWDCRLTDIYKIITTENRNVVC